MQIDKLKDKKISYISLGCDKNRVDLEQILFSIENFGMRHTANLEEANIVIVNTCAFILPARKEAIDNILEMCALKSEGKLEKIIVTGCLVSKYMDVLQTELPEVDLFVPVRENASLLVKIAKLYGVVLPAKKTDSYRPQYQTTPKHYAYLKIADGCNNGCAYCTIPFLRGRYKSVCMEDIIRQAKDFAKAGVKELILVAQDVTRYGEDLYKENRLLELIDELSKINEILWIRLHYLYPELISDRLLKAVKNNPKVVKYLDIPFQHIDNELLKSMNRRSGEKDIRTLAQKLNADYPEISLRSTFIVGLPGETKAKFNKLCDFLKEAKIHNVGFFPYYREEGTKAFYMKDQVREFIKKRRLKKIQRIQQKIALHKNEMLVGQAVEAVVEAFEEHSGNYVLRPSFCSPNLDFYVIVKNEDTARNIVLGQFVYVTITDATEDSLFGKIL